MNPQERVLKKVDRSGPDDCWNWTGPKDRDGYGRFGGGVLAHRKVWDLEVGEIPDGMCVCHHCDNPACCNIKHMFLGTQKDNIQDCFRKGRGNRSKGSSHFCTHLTDSDVRDIRKRLRRGARQKQLAQAYGVGESTISAIKTVRTWKHLLALP